MKAGGKVFSLGKIQIIIKQIYANPLNIPANFDVRGNSYVTFGCINYSFAVGIFQTSDRRPEVTKDMRLLENYQAMLWFMKAMPRYPPYHKV